MVAPFLQSAATEAGRRENLFNRFYLCSPRARRRTLCPGSFPSPRIERYNICLLLLCRNKPGERISRLLLCPFHFSHLTIKECCCGKMLSTPAKQICAEWNTLRDWPIVAAVVGCLCDSFASTKRFDDESRVGNAQVRSL